MPNGGCWVAGGAQSLCKKVGLPDSTIICWDMEETKGGGPFPALLENHIFINCIYLSKPIPPFLTQEVRLFPVYPFSHLRLPPSSPLLIVSTTMVAVCGTFCEVLRYWADS